MTEHPAYYGSPRNAVEAAARELSSIAGMLESLSGKMPAPSDRAVLDFLIVRVSDCLHALREAAGHCPE